MRRDRALSVEAGGEAAVAVGGDNVAPVITNPVVNNTLNLHVLREEPTLVSRARNLPPGVPDFTGRVAEIEVIEREVLDGRKGQRSVTAVVTGKPGVGKTCLAVHLAHRMGMTYEDGELYADLRGVDDRPAASEEIMARFMQALGVPEKEIPGDPALRLDAYRKTVTGRSLLIILDNAADEKQVRPLLPPSAGALVLVTSRNRLMGLESVHRCDLETFPISTSLDFMRKVVGDEVVDREPSDAQRVAEFCGHLPLALRIAAIRMHSTRNIRLSDLARELGDERERLEALRVGDLAVRAAFNLSYRKMGKGARNTFKRLAHVPGADFGAGICSAVTGFEVRQASRMLQKLSEANLVEQTEVPGRFRFHDLLKVFSREKMEKDPADRNQDDRRRMFLWLQNSALKAQFTLGGVFAIEVPDDGSAKIDSIETAASWVESEFPNAVAGLGVVEAYESPEHVVRLALALSGICETVGHWSEWETVIDAGARAAQKVDEQAVALVFLTARANLSRYRREFSQALTCAEEIYAAARAFNQPGLLAGAANILGCLKMDVGQTDEAIPLLRESLSIYEKLDFKHEVGKVLYNLGTIHRAAGEMEKAIEYFERDLAVCIDTADESGAAETLNTLALAHAEMGRLQKAEELQKQALEKFSKIRNQHKISMVTNDLAITLRRQGRIEEALALHLRDAEICRDVMNLSGEALAHSNAADALHRLGRNGEAVEYSTAARAVFAQLGDGQRLAKAMISHIPLLFEDGRIEEAVEGAAAAIEALKLFGDVKDVASTHQVLAREYGVMENWDESLRHAMESLEVGGTALTPYVRVVSCGMALRAASQLGREAQAAHCVGILREAFVADPSLRGAFAKTFEEEAGVFAL
ncbi:NB-ARC domain protein [Streptomyces microflavus DSM 40593]|uniref:NB-ARC domain protein n=1 Tax=Streptomyces microflavus DSM 40593 TaxID=1303692 RepID=N0CM33_STRMI|nr:tetratricopeptide repeat protein [Streptomyces microflavus]AGK77211.1 NB-ARC domain protein [Streptomyces microflavus DSM 40593]